MSKESKILNEEELSQVSGGTDDPNTMLYVYYCTVPLCDFKRTYEEKGDYKCFACGAPMRYWYKVLKKDLKYPL